MIVDIFAGAGGWDTGLAMCGRHDVAGFDHDAAACATAVAAGHVRFHDDVTEVSPGAYAGIEGLIASPPCQGLSVAGPRRGVADLDLILDAIAALGEGYTLAELLPYVRKHSVDERSPLMLQPLRWAMAALPTWLAWEQVPSGLPVWQACTRILRRLGYQVWTGVITAEQYGVPQTRGRAILTAHRERRLEAPAATHSRFYWRHPDRRDRDVACWVSMGEALDRPDALYVANNREGATTRRLDQPAPAMAFGKGWGRWHEQDGTVTKITLEEASLLQTFPADYPWHGSKEARYRQVGDAVPPLMAAHILASVV